MKVSSYNPTPMGSGSTNSKALELVQESATASSTQLQSEVPGNSGASTSFFSLSSPAVNEAQPMEISELELQHLIDELPSDSESAFEEELKNRPFRQFLDGLSEADRAMMREFHHQILRAVRDGELDSEMRADLTTKAPAVLQEFADSQNITLEDFIQKDFDRAKKRPPPTELRLQIWDFFRSEGVEPREQGFPDFFLQLREASKSGQDLSGLTEIAPQELKDFATQQGIEISELLEQIGQDMKARAALT